MELLPGELARPRAAASEAEAEAGEEAAAVAEVVPPELERYEKLQRALTRLQGMQARRSGRAQGSRQKFL